MTPAWEYGLFHESVQPIEDVLFKRYRHFLFRHDRPPGMTTCHTINNVKEVLFESKLREQLRSREVGPMT